VLNYRLHFIQEYYLNCGKYKTQQEAYEATEDAYRLQYAEQIRRGILKPQKFSGFESFKVSLTRWLQDPKNKAQL
jgi:hypothetical protein